MNTAQLRQKILDLAIKKKTATVPSTAKAGERITWLTFLIYDTIRQKSM